MGDRAVPSSNLDLHFAHCSINLEKCKVCGDMVAKKFAEEHYIKTHASTMDRNVLNDHTEEKCTQKTVTCKYCEFPLPEIDLLNHVEVCGNRTELCNLCSKYIRLRERQSHESSLCFNKFAAESSSTTRLHAERSDTRRGQTPQRFPGRLLFTIAITGIAVLLGSFAGTSERTGPRDGPVEFERIEQPEEDPFGLDQFLTEVKRGKKAMEKVGSGGTMKASASSMRDGYEGSGRSRVNFEKSRR